MVGWLGRVLMKGLDRQQPTDGAEIKAFRDYLQQFKELDFLNGQRVEGTIAAGSQFVLVRHTLGRAYVGANISGVSTAEAVMPQTPNAARDGGTDVTKFAVFFCASPVAADTVVSAWVF